MNPWSGRSAAAALALGLTFPAVLAACGSGPSRNDKAAVNSILTTTTTTSTTTTTTSSIPASSTPTTKPGAVVPNVVGEKIPDARAALRGAGFRPVSLNAACDKGTQASQSVVSSLATPGKPPTVAVGAVPLNPGTMLPPGSPVGIVWSGCYGNGSVVPDVVGLKLAAARHALAVAGLTWSCFSVGRPTTTTAPRTSTTLPPSTTTTRPPNLMLSQDPAAGAVLKPGATVALTMHVCPQ